MAEKKGGWFNFERGCCLGFAVLLTSTAGNFLATRPQRIQEDLAPPRAIESERHVITKNSLVLPDLGDDRKRDMLVPVELQISRTYRISKPTPKPAPGPKPPTPQPVVGELVRLKPKPVPKIEKPDTPSPEPTDNPREKPLPLKVLGILKPDGSMDRRVIVAPRDDPGGFFTMGEGDECDVSGEHIKVIRLTFTSVTFMRENGKTVTVDKDPLKDWKPLLKAKADEEPAEDLAHDLLGDAVNTGRDKDNSVKPDKNKTKRQKPDISEMLRKYKGLKNLKNFKGLKDLGKGKTVSPETVDKILKELRKNPDLMDKLGDFF